MNGSVLLKSILAATAAVGTLGAGVLRAHADYVQTNLVSDLTGLATVTDTELKNPWGLSFITGKSPFWISNQMTNTTTLYGVMGATNVSEFLVNPPTNVVAVAGGPTGQVSNTNSASFGGAPFIFAGLNGSISSWAGGLSATAVTLPGAAITGLAINHAQTELFAASAGGVNVFSSTFGLVGPSFTIPMDIAAAGLVPFNVKDINSDVFVTYAPSGHSAQTGAALGEGAVAVFSESGALMSETLGGDDHLASPWGITIAPTTFGKFGGDVLVGNFSFGHSEINAFDPTNWDFEGTIPVDPGLGEMQGGLWSLSFGGGGLDGSPNVLYFTDGINGEMDGLFGAIVSVPEPSTWALMLVGLGGLGFVARRRRHSPVAIG
jgi:uncharacterized protein (TIGR03118 family)